MFAAEVERSKKLSEIEPMSVIIRESRKSWRAAAWLMKWLRNRAGREMTVNDHFAWLDGEKHIE